MNREELLRIIGEAQDGYIIDAMNTRGGVHRKVRKLSPKRAVLMAAAIAMALLLVGCGVVYVMKLRDVQVGTQEATRPIWNEKHTIIQDFEPFTQQVLTLSGLKGSPNYEAAQEWFQFKQTYDPDHKKYFEKIENDPDGTWPEHRYYSVYTQEMADKVDEIAEKYGLTKMGNTVSAINSRWLYAYLGIDSILLPDSGAASETWATWYDRGGTLYADCRVTLPEETGWPYATTFILKVSSKTVFDPDFVYLDGDGTWREWNYVTAAGDNLLILRNPQWSDAWILCDRPDAMVSLRLGATREVYTDESGTMEVIQTPMTDRQVELAAEAVDWKLSPTPGDPALLEGPADMDTSAMAQTQNGLTVTLKKVETDGRIARLLAGITAPEGVDLTRDSLRFSSERLLLAGDESLVLYGCGSGRVEDGDGKANTVDFSLSYEYDHDADRSGLEGRDPFTPGTKYFLYLEKLYTDVWNSDLAQYDNTWEADGVWKFDVTFDEEDDYRELEFVDEPITTQVVTGYLMPENGPEIPCIEEQTLTSLRLRAFDAYARFDARYPGVLCNTVDEAYPYAVLKDGTRIQIHHDSGGFTFNGWDTIPLDEIDHLVLMDGTELYPHWVE